MSLFYLRDGEVYIPDRINPELTRVAKVIINTRHLTAKLKIKSLALNNAVKSGNALQMNDLMQKCFEKNKAIYEADMTLSGAVIGEVDEAFFADKDAAFYKAQLQILLDFAVINTVIENNCFPLMCVAIEKSTGKKPDEMLFFCNQGEIRKTEENEDEDSD